MKYVKHKIVPTGHINLTEKDEETGRPHGRIIKPNDSVPYPEIKEDEDFEKYRTQENTDAYEAKLSELEPTQEEIDEREAQRQLQEQRDQVKQEIKGTPAPQSNPELAKRVEKLEFVIGIRDSYEE